MVTINKNQIKKQTYKAYNSSLNFTNYSLTRGSTRLPINMATGEP